jgi:hypothetical protein
MEKNKPKIFVSYTVRDGKIDKSILFKIFHQISNESEVYIDLIHNDSIDKQNRVINELYNSNLVFLIRTEQIDNSEWVIKEISLAKMLGIPVIEFEFDELIKKEFLPIKVALKNFIRYLNFPVQVAAQSHNVVLYKLI